jgi:hypothetical protein
MARTIPAIVHTGLAALFLTAPMAAWPVMGAERTAPIPDLTGAWARAAFALEQPASGPGPLRSLTRRADGNADPDPTAVSYMNLMLRPQAAELVKKRFEATRAGTPLPTPSSSCWPMVAPYIYRVQGMQLLQAKDEVLILYMQDHEVRRVRLNGTHPAHTTPSWHGDSIGHYEGNTLVVDTVGVKVGPVSIVDEAGSPYSEALHVVERYSLIDYDAAKEAEDRNIRQNGSSGNLQAAAIDANYKGKGLQVQFTIEDPNVFTMPWSGAATYRKADSIWVENVCAENLREYYNNRDTTAPQADRPDF